MDERIRQMFHQLFSRKATSEEEAAVKQMIANLPPSILASPAAVADIVLRANTIIEMRREVDRASLASQQRIHNDLSIRIEQAAFKALTKLRDSIPHDHRDAVRRLIRVAAAWSALVFVIAVIAGWMLRGYADARHAASGNARMEQQFARCIDAAEGASATVQHDGRPPRYDARIYRDQARACAAEYADWRAGG